MTDIKLVEAAKSAQQRSYSPYSRFSVGAALLTKDGRVFEGCNVENVSFGLTMCAERVAVGAAVAAGVTEFEMIALSSDSGTPIVPCGACRQVLAEFAPGLKVLSGTVSGIKYYLLKELLPEFKTGILD